MFALCRHDTHSRPFAVRSMPATPCRFVSGIQSGQQGGEECADVFHQLFLRSCDVRLVHDDRHVVRLLPAECAATVGDRLFEQFCEPLDDVAMLDLHVLPLTDFRA